MVINSEIKSALLKINFVERYISLIKEFNDYNQTMDKYSIEKVLEILNSFGYKFKYNKSENFFKLIEDLNLFQMQLNVNCKYGVVEFIFGVLKNKERLSIGGPWNVVAKLITQEVENLKKPAFKNYYDLQNICGKAFLIYEDFKEALVNSSY